MPRATRLKVTKKPVIHPHSRAAAKLSKQSHHDNRVERRLMEKSQRLDILGEKLKWFKDNVDAEKEMYTKEEAHQLVEIYLARFEDELEQISILNSMKGRKGLQHAGRQNAIKVTLERENREYTVTGIEIPDILSQKNLDIFKKWNGEMRYIPNIRMKKLVKQSQETTETEVSNDMESEQVSSTPAESTGAEVTLQSEEVKLSGEETLNNNDNGAVEQDESMGSD